MSIILYVFTEEASAEQVFKNLLPKILPRNVQFEIFPHQGKQDLEKALRTVVPSLSKMPNTRILITRDQDSDDCKRLKNKLNKLVQEKCSSPYRIRIICRELEAWYLGDLDAIKSAYIRFNPKQYSGKAELRVVDEMINPNEYLLKILPEFSKRKRLPKLEVAQNISEYMEVDRNRSTSFNQTVKAINELVQMS